MADMPSDFWSGWIIVLTVTSFGAMVWLIVDLYRRGAKGGEPANQVWDGNLREGDKPAPLWWFWFILALMAFSVVYVMLYPGLGAYRGALEWSQGGRISERLADYDRTFGPRREQLLARSLAELGQDPELMRSAGRVFDNHCAACHGKDARGQARMFPDLRDEAWNWGGGEEQLLATIRAGRQGVMPGWQGAVGEAGVERLTDYVLALPGGADDSTKQADGAGLYQQYCVACHGAAGEGNPILGAPALNDAAWQYGGVREQVRESISVGRHGVMPAFGARLEEAQIRLLAAWLLRAP
jgi:cytochrome c oxidase cbb3-type subunit 3